MSTPDLSIDDVVTQRDDAVTQRDALRETVSQRDDAVSQRDEAISQRDVIVTQRDDAITQRDIITQADAVRELEVVKGAIENLAVVVAALPTEESLEARLQRAEFENNRKNRRIKSLGLMSLVVSITMAVLVSIGGFVYFRLADTNRSTLNFISECVTPATPEDVVDFNGDGEPDRCYERSQAQTGNIVLLLQQTNIHIAECILENTQNLAVCVEKKLAEDPLLQ